MELVGGGSVIIGDYPVYFLLFFTKYSILNQYEYTNEIVLIQFKAMFSALYVEGFAVFSCPPTRR